MDKRPMRRAKREVTNPYELREILGRAQVLRIACVDAEGLFITPMSFGFDWEDGVETPTLWVHCATEGRKTDAWAAHPEVALELDVPGGAIRGDFSCEYSYAYESIMATGRMARTTYRSQKLWGLERIMAHMAPGAPVEFSDEAVEHVDVWRIDLSGITGKRREGAPVASDGGIAPSAEPESGQKLSGDGGQRLKPVTEAEVEALLVGEKCPGCGMHCPLSDPSCGRGMEHRHRRLVQMGYELRTA